MPFCRTVAVPFYAPLPTMIIAPERKSLGLGGALPRQMLPVSVPQRCRIVRQITDEMMMLVGERTQLRRDRRRANAHVRQISMYVCHVVLQVSLTEIGQAFGRDRTTVGHACNMVEDRRDDLAFDDFVSAIERVVTMIFSVSGGSEHV